MLQCKEPIPEVLRHCNIPRRAPRRGPVTNSLEDVGWIRTDPARLIGNGPLADNLRAEYFGPWKIWAEMEPNLRWSGRLDLNQRLLGPEAVVVLIQIRQGVNSANDWNG